MKQKKATTYVKIINFLLATYLKFTSILIFFIILTKVCSTIPTGYAEMLHWKYPYRQAYMYVRMLMLICLLIFSSQFHNCLFFITVPM